MHIIYVGYSFALCHEVVSASRQLNVLVFGFAKWLRRVQNLSGNQRF